MTSRQGLFMFLILMAHTATCLGQEARKSADITYTTNPIAIDGVIEDSEWAGATVIKDLHQFDPEDHAEPSEATEILVTYDENFLYVAARLFDSNPEKIIAKQLIQGRTLRFDDTISIILDPNDTRRSGYNFQVNANGIRRESIFENVTEQNRDWTTIWFTEGRITQQGWETEIAIPFKSINFNPDNSNWGFTVRRRIARKQEDIAWTSFSRAVNPSTTGLLKGIDRAEKGIGLDIVPSVTYTERYGDTGTRESSEFRPSLDISYKITGSLSGLLTFNTDFAATEVDDRQINLTRFSLFISEKRDFFLQDADIFTFGGLKEENGIPFFSRRIGLSRRGAPLDIIAGAKVAGRIGGFNIGFLSVLQESGVPGADDVNLTVGRLSYNILDESTLGMIFTNGDPLSELSNSLIGVDFQYRNKSLVPDTDFSVNTWYQQSRTEDLSGEEAAWGIAIDVPRPEGFGGEVEFSHIEGNFKPALGFVNRRDIEQTSAEVRYIKRYSGSWIRQYTPSIGYKIVRGLDGGTQSEETKLTLVDLEAGAGDEFELGLKREREVVSRDFDIVDGVAIAAGDYTFDRAFISYESSGVRELAVEVEFSTGDFYDGELVSLSAELDWRPSSHFLFSLGYEINEADLLDGSFTTRIISARANFAFNSRWSWVNYVQYDNISEGIGINSRLRWNPKAGQNVYLVLNQGFERDHRGRFQSTITELTGKVGYTFRF